MEIQKDFLNQTKLAGSTRNKSISPPNACVAFVVNDSSLCYWQRLSDLEGQRRNLGANTTTAHAALTPRQLPLLHIVTRAMKLDVSEGKDSASLILSDYLFTYPEHTSALSTKPPEERSVYLQSPWSISSVLRIWETQWKFSDIHLGERNCPVWFYNGR